LRFLFEPIRQDRAGLMKTVHIAEIFGSRIPAESVPFSDARPHHSSMRNPGTPEEPENEMAQITPDRNLRFLCVLLFQDQARAMRAIRPDVNTR
jgi:hypothetical protein